MVSINKKTGQDNILKAFCVSAPWVNKIYTSGLQPGIAHARLLPYPGAALSNESAF